VTATQILEGVVDPPDDKDALELYALLDKLSGDAGVGAGGAANAQPPSIGGEHARELV
jgi:hypothetical protein